MATDDTNRPETPETTAPAEAPPAWTRDKPAPDPVPPPPRRRRGWIFAMLGGGIAAALGFGLAQLVPQGWPLRGTEALEARTAAQEAGLRTLADQVAGLASAPAPAPPEVDLSPLEARLDEAAARLTALEGRPAPVIPDLSPRLDALEVRLATLESLPLGGEAADPGAASALLREVAALRAEVAAQKAAQEGMTAEVAAAAEAARTALEAAEAEAARLRDAAQAAAQEVLMRAAAARLIAAVEAGSPLAPALDELVAGGVTVPGELADLSGGVPLLAALQEAFPDAARAALAEARRNDAGETTMDRLGGFLLNATGARSLTPREGDDPDAVLSRAEAALRAGNVAGALAELDTLPPETRAPMAEWQAAARQRVQAATLAADLAAGLGG